jgi:hypothetical protein
MAYPAEANQHSVRMACPAYLGELRMAFAVAARADVRVSLLAGGQRSSLEVACLLDLSSYQLAASFMCERKLSVPGNGKGGRPGPPAGNPPGIGPIMPPCCSMGFCPACPASAYDDVMESITLCAFSWPISARD